VTSTVPSPSRHGTVELDGERGRIRFERLLSHPIERVWEAITTPAGLAGWWMPFAATIEIDLVVGGTISFSATELGEEPMTCEVLEVDRPHRLVHTHFDRSMTLTWDLEQDGEGCRLRLTQDTPNIHAALDQGFIIGLHHSLDRLEPALAGRPESWDWDRLPILEKEYAERLGGTVARQDVVDLYIDGFRGGDHAAILACLTDDVTWDIVGHASATGMADFERLIDGPEGASLPRLTVERHVAADDLVVTFGAGEFDDAEGASHSFRFVDTFTFRDNLIAAVVSYVVPT
jgi:uncharacterized protein YndB with AHSA1/START domain/ketosteroid isomerase-like protein